MTAISAANFDQDFEQVKLWEKKNLWSVTIKKSGFMTDNMHKCVILLLILEG